MAILSLPTCRLGVEMIQVPLVRICPESETRHRSYIGGSGSLFALLAVEVGNYCVRLRTLRLDEFRWRSPLGSAKGRRIWRLLCSLHAAPFGHFLVFLQPVVSLGDDNLRASLG